MNESKQRRAKRIRKLFRDFIKGRRTVEGRALFEQWIKDKSSVDAPETQIPAQQKREALEDIYARLQIAIARGEKPGVVHMGKRVWKWAAAAVLIVGIGSFLWRMVSHRASISIS